jgi:hypothetical protein
MCGWDVGKNFPAIFTNDDVQFFFRKVAKISLSTSQNNKLKIMHDLSSNSFNQFVRSEEKNRKKFGNAIKSVINITTRKKLQQTGNSVYHGSKEHIFWVHGLKFKILGFQHEIVD